MAMTREERAEVRRVRGSHRLSPADKPIVTQVEADGTGAVLMRSIQQLLNPTYSVSRSPKKCKCAWCKNSPRRPIKLWRKTL